MTTPDRNRWSPPPFDVDPLRPEEPVQLAPCGECPVGECDDCRLCVVFREAFAKLPNGGRLHGSYPGWDTSSERGGAVGLVLAGFVGALVGFGLGLAVAWAVLS